MGLAYSFEFYVLSGAKPPTVNLPITEYYGVVVDPVADDVLGNGKMN